MELIVTKNEIVELVTFLKACKVSGYMPDGLIDTIENLVREHIKAEKIIQAKNGGAGNAI